ncbi:IcmL-like protein [Legionella donaldsonii]|uniref:IcmL-like protein n=1 Tax=Legionella donaldsonii TaxID=45060 RepID=A0A378J6M7_9GAMM|nr:DotI/IcmL family type IV secretion protein [Legionella donaldsonii]STX43433.1 IcmL-like protein [Legionella donaldsonii]
MKKSMLCAGLMTVLCTTIYAENSAQPANSNAGDTLQTKPAPTTLGASASPAVVQPAPSQTAPTQTPQGTPAPTPQGTPAPTPQGTPTPTPQGTPTPTPQGTPTPTPQGTPTPALQGTPAPVSQGTVIPAGTSTTTPAKTPMQVTPITPPQPIDCNYRIPAETTHIEQALVLKWAEKAAAQSFDFDYSTLDKQLLTLKSCYTDQGWQGFNDALQKSGNLNAIKSQQLMVSSMVNGTPTITELKENQWKVVLPLQVVYQNDKEKLTQPLTINLVVGRKISGDLGIMQMIATPRQSSGQGSAQTTPTTNTTTSPASTTKSN